LIIIGKYLKNPNLTSVFFQENLFI